jgi:hypothetical protein
MGPELYICEHSLERCMLYRLGACEKREIPFAARLHMGNVLEPELFVVAFR